MPAFEALVKELHEFEHERIRNLRGEILTQVGLTAAVIATLGITPEFPLSNSTVSWVCRIAWVLSVIGVIWQSIYLARALLGFRTMYEAQPAQLKKYLDDLVAFHSNSIRDGHASSEASAEFENGLTTRRLEVTQKNHERSNKRYELLYKARFVFVLALIPNFVVVFAPNLCKLLKFS